MTLLRVEGLEKRYGGIRALRGASLTLNEAGEVHALFGENGSGKSTLLSVLAGLQKPDAGLVEVSGSRITDFNTATALQHGIAMVSQESALALDLSVGENVLLGRRLVKRKGRIRWRETMSAAERVLARLGQQHYDSRQTVRQLRPDQRQMVEIARAVSQDAKILILDEPTSSLSDDQATSLFRVVRELSEIGVAIIFVSHRMTEAYSICKRFTILRDGVDVDRGVLSERDGDQIVACLTGVERSGTPSSARTASGVTAAPGKSGLELKKVAIFEPRETFDLHLRRGQIIGLAGSTASGRSELLAAVFGLRRLAAGQILLDGEQFSAKRPADAIAAGLGYVPPDRKNQGVILTMSARENLSMIASSRRSRLALPRKSAEQAMTAESAKAMRLKLSSLDAPVGSLSGGNQQKVALGKWLVAGAQTLLLDEPTRGVDVVAKREIHELLRELAAKGHSVLFSSGENDELADLCDQTFVFFRGSLAARLDREETTEATISWFAGGHS